MIKLNLIDFKKGEKGNFKVNWENISKIKYVLVPVLVGGIVGFIISSFIDYESLNKPFLSPPKLAFPIAWIIIYILMGILFTTYLNFGFFILN